MLQPRRVVHVQPGQVHRWRFARYYDTTVLLFDDPTGDLLRPGWPIGPQWFELDDTEWDHAQQVIALARREIALRHPARRRDRALHGALQRLIVSLGLDLARESERSNLPRLYIDLLNQLETDREWSRSVTDRADRLGYAPRTLTRACQQATGRTAKQVIDDRIMLEARRLLVHPTTTIDPIARQLSFSEAGNFAKFFQRHAGENPDAWRNRNDIKDTPGL
ncbi:MAG: helix-turn-helix transcriptional regulator [Acidimicrobiales bacterium]